MDAQQAAAIAAVMKDALHKRLGQEIDLIFHYGSMVTGKTHEHSDLDFSYVPHHESTWESITVLVEDVLFDLYPLQWSTLEQMAAWDDWRATILLAHKVVYTRNEAVARRFAELVRRHASGMQPEAGAEMVGKALQTFEQSGYDFYLLAEAADRLGAGRSDLSCRYHANRIMSTVFFSLALANQSPADTRKLDQVLALERRPKDLESRVTEVLAAHSANELLEATQHLLRVTRELLRSMQAESCRTTAAYPAQLDAAYPELRADVQRVFTGCGRGDALGMQTKLLSYLYELHVHLAQAETGIAFSSFNTPGDYERDLVSAGFPDLAPLLDGGNPQGLAETAHRFDDHLKRFLRERGVRINDFASIGDLEAAIERGEV